MSSSFEDMRATAAKAAQSAAPGAVKELLGALGAAKDEDAFVASVADLYDKKTTKEQGAILAFIGADDAGAGLAPVRKLVDKAVQRAMLNAAARIDGEVKATLAQVDRSVADARAQSEELHRKQGQR